MPACKTCGINYTLWSARGDGLCKLCGSKADDEQERGVLAQTKRNIDLIVKAATNKAAPDKELLGYTFIHRRVQKKGSGLLGTAVGGALFGVSGAMIGNTLGSLDAGYSGELGVLVVTENKVIIGHFCAPFLSRGGKISSGHLELFRTQLNSRKVACTAFDIRHTQLTQHPDGTVTLGTHWTRPEVLKDDFRVVRVDVCPINQTLLSFRRKLEGFSFRKSDLYVNDAHYELPSATAVCNLIVERGALPTPADFVSRLEREQNPIPTDQFADMKDADNYTSEVCALVLRHPARDKLVQNCGCLDQPVRELLKTQIKEKAASIIKARTQLGLAIGMAIVGGVAAAMTEGFLSFLSGLCATIGILLSIAAVANLRGTIWCREALGLFD